MKQTVLPEEYLSLKHTVLGKGTYAAAGNIFSTLQSFVCTPAYKIYGQQPIATYKST